MRLNKTDTQRLADLEAQPIGARVECPQLGGCFRRFRRAAGGDHCEADWAREDDDSQPPATSTMLVAAGFIPLDPHQNTLF